MAKTGRLLKETIGACDAVAELLDARIPLSSRNPDIAGIIGKKPHIVLLNKCDLADDKVTEEWVKYFRNKGVKAIPVDSKNSKSLESFKSAVKALLSEKIAENISKGMVGKMIKIMVVGIPNVGKSSFINRLAGSSKAKAENRPGVTKSNQWFVVDKDIEILDTPGVLWPKFEDNAVGEKLAFTGAITDRILDVESLAVRLISVLAENYPDLLVARYGDVLSEDPLTVMENIASKRGMIMRGGDFNYERTANMIFEEFRSAKIGKISLERP